jgi:hypothetical protein
MAEINVTIANGASESDTIDLTRVVEGVIIKPATLDATTVLGFKVCGNANGTFVTLYDSSGTLVAITVSLTAAQAIEIPRSVLSNNYIKLFTCTTAGVAVTQTGAKAFSGSLKRYDE